MTLLSKRQKMNITDETVRTLAHNIYEKRKLMTAREIHHLRHELEHIKLDIVFADSFKDDDTLKCTCGCCSSEKLQNRLKLCQRDIDQL